MEENDDIVKRIEQAQWRIASYMQKDTCGPGRAAIFDRISSNLHIYAKILDTPGMLTKYGHDYVSTLADHYIGQIATKAREWGLDGAEVRRVK